MSLPSWVAAELLQFCANLFTCDDPESAGTNPIHMHSWFKGFIEGTNQGEGSVVTLTAPQEREEKVWFPAPRSGSSQPLLSPVTHQCLLASADTYTDTVHISPCRYIKNTSNRNICLLHFYLNTTRLGLWGMHCFRHFLRKTNKNTHHIPRIKRSSYPVSNTQLTLPTNREV